MAGGFFREDNNVTEVKLEPIVLADLPKISSNVAKPSVSLSLDAATSSGGESSDERELEDVAGSVFQMESANDLMKQSSNFGTSHIPTEDIHKQNHAKVISELVTEAENKNSDDVFPKENSSDSVRLNEEKIDLDNGKIPSVEIDKTLSEEIGGNIPIDNKGSVNEGADETLSFSQSPDDLVNNVTTCFSSTTSSGQKSSEIREQQELSPERTIETELDDLEDEINEKKRLIEKLLSNRRTSNIIKSSSDANESVGNLLEEKSLSDMGQNDNSMRGGAASDTGSLGVRNETKNAECNFSTAVETEDSFVSISTHDVCETETAQAPEIDAPTPNEFEGITYVSIVIYKL